MKQRVLVVSHADADGHVIAEQVRRNLEVVPAFEVTTVIDPIRTKDHKAWLHLDELSEIERSDLVFFVDLMFAPASFGTEADALVRFARARPEKRFFVLDHHPLPIRRLSAAPNLRAVYRQDVLDCKFGPSSPMMIIAALCEKQPTRAKELKKPIHDVLVRAMRRAAAPGGPLPGAKLSALLRFDRWKELEALGLEDASHHALPRGRRRAGAVSSKTLIELDKTATDLLRSPSSPPQRVGVPVPYDFGVAIDHAPPTASTAPANKHDLEAIVMLLELAAIQLSPEPGAEFSIEELLGEARTIGGEGIDIQEADVDIVLDKAAFLKKAGKRFRLK